MVQFTAAVTQEGDWRVARCLEVEIASQGHTIDEALANLREALELYFEDEALPEGLKPRSSPPSNSLREPGAAGRLRCRIVAALTKGGFVRVSQRGSHAKMRKDDPHRHRAYA